MASVYIVGCMRMPFMYHYSNIPLISSFCMNFETRTSPIRNNPYKRLACFLVPFGIWLGASWSCTQIPSCSVFDWCILDTWVEGVTTSTNVVWVDVGISTGVWRGSCCRKDWHIIPTIPFSTREAPIALTVSLIFNTIQTKDPLTLLKQPCYSEISQWGNLPRPL